MTAGSDSPLVSVVVPTKDRPAALGRAVASVNAQTYPRIELVVVDGSDPPAEATVRSAPHDGIESVRYLRHTEGGAGAARNVGIDAASGDYLAFLDDDDRWEPEKLARQMEQFAAGPPDVGVVYTGQRYVDDDGRTTAVYTPEVTGDVTEQLLRGDRVGPFSTFVVQAGLVDRVGNVDEKLPTLEDRDWLIRLSRASSFDVVAEPLVRRHMGSHEQLTDDFEAARDVTHPRMLARHRDLAASYGEGCRRAYVSMLAQTVASAAFANGRYLSCLRYATRAIRHNPSARGSYLYVAASFGGPLTADPARWLRRRLGGRA